MIPLLWYDSVCVDLMISRTYYMLHDWLLIISVIRDDLLWWWFIWYQWCCTSELPVISSLLISEITCCWLYDVSRVYSSYQFISWRDCLLVIIRYVLHSYMSWQRSVPVISLPVISDTSCQWYICVSDQWSCISVFL